MELKTILLDVEDQIATITLNRPKRMNAWTGRMHTEYRWVLEQLDNDADVRVIVVTATGKGFCVGADSKALEGHVEKGGYDPGTPDTLANPGFGIREEFDANFAYHFGISKPIIAAINGPAAGIGLVLACYADIRFAVPNIKMTTAHGKLNLPAEFGLSWLLPRLIGVSAATELLLTSRVFTSEEAEKLGLITRVIERETLMAEVLDYAKMLKNTISPASLRETKWQIYTDLHRDIGSSVRESESLLLDMMKQKDYPEAIAAYMEKRQANWTGE